jgi:hypothetical protein
VSGRNANYSASMLCALYVLLLGSPSPYATFVQLAACSWLAMFSLSQRLVRLARLEECKGPAAY